MVFLRPRSNGVLASKPKASRARLTSRRHFKLGARMEAAFEPGGGVATAARTQPLYPPAGQGDCRIRSTRLRVICRTRRSGPPGVVYTEGRR